MDCSHYNFNEFNFHNKLSKLLRKYDKQHKARISCDNWWFQNWLSCFCALTQSRTEQISNEKFGVWQGELDNQSEVLLRGCETAKGQAVSEIMSKTYDNRHFIKAVIRPWNVNWIIVGNFELIVISLAMIKLRIPSSSLTAPV
jgi:hypothetical protein